MTNTSGTHTETTYSVSVPAPCPHTGLKHTEKEREIVMEDGKFQGERSVIVTYCATCGQEINRVTIK